MALVAIFAGGCEAPQAPEFHPVFPPPPAQARIEHIKTIRGPADAAKPTFFQRLVGAAAGSAGPRLVRPTGVALDEDRRLYIADQERQGVVVLDLTSSKTSLISRVGNTFLVSPVSVAVCGRWLAVSDSSLNSIFMMTLDGKFKRTIGKPGGFGRVTGLSYDAKRNLLYAVDTLANEVCAFDPDDGRLVRKIGSRGIGPAEFNFPTHVYVDADGRLFVTDSLNFRVQAFDADGRYLFHLGQAGDATGYLGVPKGIGVDSFGHIYIADSYFDAVQIFDSRGRFLLAFGEAGEENGKFHIPTGLTVDSKNRIYVCDSHNMRVQVFQYVGGAPDAQLATQPATLPTTLPSTMPVPRRTTRPTTATRGGM